MRGRTGYEATCDMYHILSFCGHMGEGGGHLAPSIPTPIYVLD